MLQSNKNKSYRGRSDRLSVSIPTPVQVFVAFIDHVSTARLKSCKDGRTDGSSKTRKE